MKIPDREHSTNRQHTSENKRQTVTLSKKQIRMTMISKLHTNEHDTKVQRKYSQVGSGKGPLSLENKYVRKNNRNQGKAYTNESGKEVQARCLKAVNCSKCRLKCTSKISEGQRQYIFSSSWQLGSYERQRHFICEHIDSNKLKRKTKNSSDTQVHTSNHYHFLFLMGRSCAYVVNSSYLYLI